MQSIHGRRVSAPFEDAKRPESFTAVVRFDEPV